MQAPQSESKKPLSLRLEAKGKKKTEANSRSTLELMQDSGGSLIVDFSWAIKELTQSSYNIGNI